MYTQWYFPDSWFTSRAIDDDYDSLLGVKRRVGRHEYPVGQSYCLGSRSDHLPEALFQRAPASLDEAITLISWDSRKGRWFDYRVLLGGPMDVAEKDVTHEQAIELFTNSLLHHVTRMRNKIAREGFRYHLVWIKMEQAQSDLFYAFEKEGEEETWPCASNLSGRRNIMLWKYGSGRKKDWRSSRYMKLLKSCEQRTSQFPCPEWSASFQASHVKSAVSCLLTCQICLNAKMPVVMLRQVGPMENTCPSRTKPFAAVHVAKDLGLNIRGVAKRRQRFEECACY